MILGRMNEPCPLYLCTDAWGMLGMTLLVAYKLT